jgi:hypothetical protein
MSIDKRIASAVRKMSHPQNKENPMLEMDNYLERNGDKLLTREAILYRSEPAKQVGVYFLIQDREIVYVGQSQKLPDRIQQHIPGKVFNRVAFLECKKENLLRLEQAYINLLCPRYNLEGFAAQRAPHPKKYKGPGPAKRSFYD